MHLHKLTESQEITLDRIANSAAGPHTRIVGWALDGPVLMFKERLVALRSSGQYENVDEIEASIA
jgi:hypothetical protein